MSPLLLPPKWNSYLPPPFPHVKKITTDLALLPVIFQSEQEKQFEKTDIEAAEEEKVKTLSTLSLLEEEDKELDMEKSLPLLEEVDVIKEVNSNIVEVAEGEIAIEEEDVRI